MRGPNKHYACVSGPNGTSCRFCVMRRWRALNRERAIHGLPKVPRPELPPRPTHPEQPCPCDACQVNREKVKAAYRRKNPEGMKRSRLDLKALQSWPAAWGTRNWEAA